MFAILLFALFARSFGHFSPQGRAAEDEIGWPFGISVFNFCHLQCCGLLCVLGCNPQYSFISVVTVEPSFFPTLEPDNRRTSHVLNGHCVTAPIPVPCDYVSS